MVTRLILADSQPVVLYGLERLLRLEPDFQILARCTDGFAALAASRRQRPDVLIVEAHLPGKNGLAVLRELRREGSSIKAVLIADALDDDEVLEAFRLGVRGMLLKEFALQMMVQCVRTVRSGEPWFERQASCRALEVLLHRDTDRRVAAGQLTLREAELVRLAARGLRTREMSQHLAISTGTVKTHLHRVYRKLHVKDRLGLAQYARAKKLV